MTVNSSCVTTSFDNTGAHDSGEGIPSCGAYGGSLGEDMWFSFVVPASGEIVVTTSNNGGVTNVDLALYTGTCSSLTEISCDANSAVGPMAKLIETGLTPGDVVFARVWEAGGNAFGTFDICVYEPEQGDLPCDPIPLTVSTLCNTISVDNTSMNDSGEGAPSCGNYGGDDIWFSFVVPSTGDFTITTSNNGGLTNLDMALYSGVCSSLTEVSCDVNSGLGNHAEIVQSGLSPGDIYLVRVWESGGNAYGTFDICIVEDFPPGDVPCGAINLTVNTTCSYSTFNNATMNNSGIVSPSCGSYSTEDMWFTVTVPGSGNINISTLDNVGTFDMVLTVYSGLDCNNLTEINCDDDSGPGVMPELYMSGLTVGETLWIRLFDNGAATSGSFDICVYECDDQNDLPCDARPIPIGSTLSNQDNGCATGIGEPAIPGCWSSGTVESLWYSFVAPASGEITVFTSGVLETQIALYSGTCSSLTEIDCNRDFCNSENSQIKATGLTAGDTYFVIVDGENGQDGLFNIGVLDGTNNIIPGQDCQVTIPVCQNNFSIGNPGYGGEGLNCDYDGSENCTGGEKNAVWYNIICGGAGELNFVIMPNDGSASSCGTETDYDFSIWRVISGSGFDPVTTCSDLNNATGAAALVACNYDSYGVTGVSSTGNSPVGINTCFNDAFESTINAVAGDQYILVVENYSGSTEGFDIDFSNSDAGVLDFSFGASSLLWGGATDSDWSDVSNWSGCSTPLCGIDATILSLTNQPTISGTENVKDLVIASGATLTLAAGSTLNICGDFVNNGSLVCDPTSTVVFNNASVTQNITGSFTGVNSFGNLVITKTGGSVVLNSDIEVAGDLTTSNSTSILDVNSNDITLGGDISLNSPGTFTNIGTSRLTFNGAAAQDYDTGGDLTLNDVTINHTSTGVTLTDNLIIGASGSLALTNGVFITGANRVELNNTAATSVGTGSTISYIQGNLRHYITGSTAYDFPVGDGTSGYQRANVSFTTATTINYLDAKFEAWSGALPGNLGTNECITASYDLDALNNGFFTIDASNTPTSGNYDMTLYNTLGSYTNEALATGWTVMKNSGSGWGLDGTCVTSSTVNVVGRTGMNGFSTFATAQNSSIYLLPIELVSFYGYENGAINTLKWVTASESDVDYYKVERAIGLGEFVEIGEVQSSGNSTEIVEHTFYDLNPLQKAYYRVTVVNVNGEDESTTNVIYIERGNSSNQVNVYPNPTNGEVHLDFIYQSDDNLDVYIMDINGKLIKSLNFDVTKGYNPNKLELNRLANGLYYVKITSRINGQTETIKLIKE